MQPSWKERCSLIKNSPQYVRQHLLMEAVHTTNKYFNQSLHKTLLQSPCHAANQVAAARSAEMFCTFRSQTCRSLPANAFKAEHNQRAVKPSGGGGKKRKRNLQSEHAGWWRRRMIKYWLEWTRQRGWQPNRPSVCVRIFELVCFTLLPILCVRWPCVPGPRWSAAWLRPPQNARLNWCIPSALSFLATGRTSLRSRLWKWEQRKKTPRTKKEGVPLSPMRPPRWQNQSENRAL